MAAKPGVWSSALTGDHSERVALGCRKEEKWLILVTTDHGGRGTKHGGQPPEERTIWMLANGNGVKPSTVIAGSVPQTAIAPTILQYLGVRSPEEWPRNPSA